MRVVLFQLVENEHELFSPPCDLAVGAKTGLRCGAISQCGVESVTDPNQVGRLQSPPTTQTAPLPQSAPAKSWPLPAAQKHQQCQDRNGGACGRADNKLRVKLLLQNQSPPKVNGKSDQK